MRGDLPISRGDLADLPAREVRADIQGLRAIAVLLVLGYHLWPDRIPGGFVGVDVFFVVSGFLITSHLLRSPPRRPADFVAFWGRRLRRLLPASLLVIAVTVIVGSVVLPATQLADLGRDALAAVFYVENWNLAARSVDYLALGAAPSPLQHYWSLGVEEQFYLLWPFLIAAAAGLAMLTRRSSSAVALAVLGTFAVVSLIVSVVWTALDPASAYFSTFTRLWELGAGGIVAVLLTGRLGVVERPVARSVAALIAVVGIAASAFVFTSDLPFPGWIAILPIAATCLFIAANAPRSTRFSPTRPLAWRPIQFIGDTSYSIYLWHFPLIVLAGAVLGPLTIVPKVLIIVASLALAWLTKVLVEDPVRTSTRLRRALPTYVAAVIVTVLVAAVTFIPAARVAAIVAESKANVAEVIEVNQDCLGAAALVSRGCEPHGTGIAPSPVEAPTDVSDAYADGCFADKPFSDVPTCEYGAPTARYRIALVGNSHAVQWLPALQELAGELDASITTFVASGCPPTDALVLLDTPANSAGCQDWGAAVLAETADRFDLVIMTVASNSDLVDVAPADKYEPQTVGYASLLGRWADAGQRVLVIRDTPIPFVDIPDCLAGNPGDVAACDGERRVWLTPDPLVAAVDRVDDPLVTTVDFSDHFCDATTCYAVLGGILVYFDYMHVGATFSRTLAPYLGDAVESALATR